MTRSAPLPPPPPPPVELLDPLLDFVKYFAIASRIAVSDATTGSTCRPVMNLMSSIAKTFVGSVIASVSVVPLRPTGITLYLVAVSTGHQADDRRVEVELRRD